MKWTDAVELDIPEDELRDKYRHLIRELPLVKSQLDTATKSIITEKEHAKQLQIKMKRKDHTIRTYEQDLDMTKYHNERMIKRIQILQSELNDQVFELAVCLKHM